MTDSSDPEYLLGHHEREWDRLSEQHVLWREGLLGALLRAGLSQGAAALEVGCGSGVLLRDLAAIVGEGGRAVGLERDRAAYQQARETAAMFPHAEVRLGDLTTAGLGGPWDVIVARWVFSFLPNPAAAVDRLAGALKPGGALLIQDYDHDGVRMFPDPGGAIHRVIEGFRAAYRARGGDLWVGPKLPGLMRAAGLTVTPLAPEVKAGGPESAPWRWVERFLFEHIDTLITDGHLSEAERAAFEAAWAIRRADPDSVLVTPIQVTVTGVAG